MKKELFSKKIEKLNEKGGFVQLDDKDRKEFIDAMNEYINKESEKMENFFWVIVGLFFGILGNFIVNLFYDWIKSKGSLIFGLLSIFVILSFVVLLLIFFFKMKEYKESIDSGFKAIKIWQNAKSIEVGPPMKAYDNEEWKELQNQNKNIKKG